MIRDDIKTRRIMKEKLLSVNDIIETLKVSKLTIYRYIKSGKLPAYKVGRDYRIKENDFKKLLESKRTK